jgi:hypothetical protein
MTLFTALIYPELERFSPDAREAALARARRRPLDGVELAGLGLSVVLVALLTRYGAAELDAIARLTAATANLVLAIPLLALVAGPFLWRRTRRALRLELGDPAA